MTILSCRVIAAGGATWPGTTRTASDWAGVASAVSASSNGDVVILEDGSYTANSQIDLTSSKGILVRARNVGNVNITHANGAGTLFQMTKGSGNYPCLFGLNFLPGSATGIYVGMDGTTTKIHMIGKCQFGLPHFQLAHAIHWHVTGGLMWGSYFYGIGSGGQGPGSGSGSVVIKGNTRDWYTDSTMGALDDGTNNVYIEDCSFFNVGQCPDIDDHGRVVCRYTTFDGGGGLTHGPTSTYAGRHFEYYNNTFDTTTSGRDVGGRRYFWCRAGTGIFTDNVVNIPNQGFGVPVLFVMCVENATRGGAWGCATSYPAVGAPACAVDASGSHQCGWGFSGSAHVSDPIYSWSNTGAGAYTFSFNDGSPDTCGNGKTTTDFLTANVDYFVNNGAKPGYSKFTYPHPLKPTLVDNV